MLASPPTTEVTALRSVGDSRLACTKQAWLSRNLAFIVWSLELRIRGIGFPDSPDGQEENHQTAFYDRPWGNFSNNLYEVALKTV